MYRFLLTPRWWGINVFVLLAIPFCIYMGSWQLGRFEDRVESHEGARQQADSAQREAAEPVDDLLPVTKATSGRQATASGRYAEQLLVPDRDLDGRSGTYVLTLLRTDSGRALPVVRGWLPGAPDPASVPAPPSGEVTVTGALQASETPGNNGVSARGGLPEGQTAAISAASLVNLVPYDVYDAWVTLNRGDSGMRAVPATAPSGTGLDLKAFQNLGYTAEWFAFVGFVIFMWFRLLRRELEFARDAELGLLPDEDGDRSGGADAGVVGKRDGEGDGTGSTPGPGGSPGTADTPGSASMPDRAAGDRDAAPEDESARDREQEPGRPSPSGV
ncbi:SURF1 family protein [Streptomyces sp. bgisy022]|uniref:SURF1 family protein n=1 Tax=Streptomyces sp. bgisy022 TaxID=3413769 RepID=UPI003D73D70D